MPTLMKFYCLISNLQIEADLLFKKKKQLNPMKVQDTE